MRTCPFSLSNAPQPFIALFNDTILPSDANAAEKRQVLKSLHE